MDNKIRMALKDFLNSVPDGCIIEIKVHKGKLVKVPVQERKISLSSGMRSVFHIDNEIILEEHD